MRPQRFAAEIGPRALWPCMVERASMRPQRFAAEIVVTVAILVDEKAASMRPQRFAAEIRTGPTRVRPSGGCFNEAAAFRCGDLPEWNTIYLGLDRFNEAAAFRCGDRAFHVRTPRGSFSLQ